MVRAGVADAARVNARWCDTVCRSHGFTGTFGPRSWRSARRTPPLYPDAVTLAPDASVSDVLDGIDTSPGCSVKDSFGCLDLSEAGFEVLFEATWIAREVRMPLEPGWSRMPDQFDDPFVAVWSDGVSGVTANRDGDFAGLSNLYTRGDLGDAWRGATSAVATTFPGLPITGYERGDDLAAALRAGYTALGPLRIWLK
ncbi:hypothetical protein AVL48_09550 [Amycolatopsis regifaucium]|uniref:Uncharacterized protein n=1 Tax=Amycolatopsis regifaucium TaxID=546365 RepID=A0A154MD43_9PSEU|nr:hypothetical protein AVL48_09550 [Amycolatopsis regifaucium]OKA05758.1 hypothetical protein ATP06_0221440 [Amycolatopsis regifaucium]SFG85021.1 hypothetical protein SAMN04489731_101694 [Amycolatopsis regifaucium]